MFLDWLFGKTNNDNAVDLTLTSILPVGAMREIESGNLPVFNTATIVMSKNEICHFIDKSILVAEEKRKSYKSNRFGSSIRILKGWTIHLGNGNMSPNITSVQSFHKGILYITNERIVFSSQKEVFDKKLKNLSSIIPYKDGITFQFGDRTYNVLLCDAKYALTILNILTANN